MLRPLIVFVAGGAGSVSRYLLGGRIQLAVGTAFPYGTLSVNILGSFIIALVMGLSLRSTWISAELRLLLTTGFCGGFTTYSTFNYETLTLAQQSSPASAAAYVGSTLLGGLLAGALGLWLARMIAG